MRSEGSRSEESTQEEQAQGRDPRGVAAADHSPHLNTGCSEGCRWQRLRCGAQLLVAGDSGTQKLLLLVSHHEQAHMLVCFE